LMLCQPRSQNISKEENRRRSVKEKTCPLSPDDY
jgi:hypothetical protein